MSSLDLGAYEFLLDSLYYTDSEIHACDNHIHTQGHSHSTYCGFSMWQEKAWSSTSKVIHATFSLLMFFQCLQKLMQAQGTEMHILLCMYSYADTLVYA